MLEEKHNDKLKHEIWNKVKEILGKDFDVGIVHYNKYIPTKRKSYRIENKNRFS